MEAVWEKAQSTLLWQWCCNHSDCLFLLVTHVSMHPWLPVVAAWCLLCDKAVIIECPPPQLLITELHHQGSDWSLVKVNSLWLVETLLKVIRCPSWILGTTLESLKNRQEKLKIIPMRHRRIGSVKDYYRLAPRFLAKNVGENPWKPTFRGPEILFRMPVDIIIYIFSWTTPLWLP